MTKKVLTGIPAYINIIENKYSGKDYKVIDTIEIIKYIKDQILKSTLPLRKEIYKTTLDNKSSYLQYTVDIGHDRYGLSIIVFNSWTTVKNTKIYIGATHLEEGYTIINPLFHMNRIRLKNTIRDSVDNQLCVDLLDETSEIRDLFNNQVNDISKLNYNYLTSQRKELLGNLTYDINFFKSNEISQLQNLINEREKLIPGSKMFASDVTTVLSDLYKTIDHTHPKLYIERSIELFNHVVKFNKEIHIISYVSPYSSPYTWSTLPSITTTTPYSGTSTSSGYISTTASIGSDLSLRTKLHEFYTEEIKKEDSNLSLSDGIKAFYTKENGTEI